MCQAECAVLGGRFPHRCPVAAQAGICGRGRALSRPRPQRRGNRGNRGRGRKMTKPREPQPTKQTEPSSAGITEQQKPQRSGVHFMGGLRGVDAPVLSCSVLYGCNTNKSYVGSCCSFAGDATCPCFSNMRLKCFLRC